MKKDLLEEVGIHLLKKGYTIKTLTRTCFDLLARFESTILLVKVLEDANSIDKEYAEEMQRLSAYINGSPLIVAEKAGQKLADNVVYSRFGVYTLNFFTFENCIENRMPFIKKDHAGLKAVIQGSQLEKKMEEKGLSLKGLAHRIGVSRQMVQKYKSGSSEITVQKAFKLYDLFGGTVFRKINVFKENMEVPDESKSDISRKYTNLGFEASDAHKVPFDVIAKLDKELILTKIGEKPNPQAESLSRLLDADNLVIFRKKKPKGIPAITKKEFLEFQEANELIKFLKEF